MDEKIIWSPESIEDLESIAEYIERDSVFYARAVITKVLEATQNIEDFPLAGRIVPEIGDDKVRERFVYSYRLGMSDWKSSHPHRRCDTWQTVI